MCSASQLLNGFDGYSGASDLSVDNECAGGKLQAAISLGREHKTREYMKESICNWCGHRCVIGPGPAVKQEWLRGKCRGCGTISFVDTPDASALSQVYDQSWNDDGADDSLATGSTDQAIANSLLDAFNWSPSDGEFCLDYGAGHGHFSKALMDSGSSSVHAFEPFGVKPEWLDVMWIKNTNDLPRQTYRWIFLIEVLEHMLDPVSELREIRQLLTPDGQLILTTPNAGGVRARLDGFDWREAQNPTHINLFSNSALVSCLQAAGFDRLDRNYGPVTYLATGPRAAALKVLQRLGLDGGLRFTAGVA